MFCFFFFELLTSGCEASGTCDWRLHSITSVHVVMDNDDVIKERRLKKEFPGLSWIEVAGKTHLSVVMVNAAKRTPASSRTHIHSLPTVALEVCPAQARSPHRSGPLRLDAVLCSCVCVCVWRSTGHLPLCGGRTLKS